MAATLLDLQKSVLHLLNEDYDSVAGNLENGTGSGSPTITTLDAIKGLLNEGVSDMARTCFPVPGTAVGTEFSTRTALLGSLTPTVAGQIMWTVRGVRFIVSSPASNTALRYADRAAVERNDPGYLLTAAAIPQYWYNDGPQSLGVYPVPVGAGTLNVDGYVVPAPLSASGDTLATTFPDDLTNIPVWYAAAMIAMKNREDESLFVRAQMWMDEYDKARMDLWTKIPASLRRAHFPAPPIPMK